MSSITNNSCAMSTEDFLRFEVFKKPLTTTTNQADAKKSFHNADNRLLFNRNFTKPPQTGPSDKYDLTPNALPNIETNHFSTLSNIDYGKMTLHKNSQGQIISREILFYNPMNNNISKMEKKEYTYDKVGRLTTVIIDDECIEKYTYGEKGERKTDINKTYIYDQMLRLKSTS